MPQIAHNFHSLAGLMLLGGPGSGNHGHAGRPGEVGGSREGEGEGRDLPDLSSEKTPGGRSAYKLIREGVQQGFSSDQILTYVKSRIPHTKVTKGHVAWAVKKAKAKGQGQGQAPVHTPVHAPVPVPKSPKAPKAPKAPVVSPVTKPAPSPLPSSTTGHKDTGTPAKVDLAARAKAAGSVLSEHKETKDAVLKQTTEDGDARKALIDKIGTGPALARAHKEYAETPLHDLQVLSGIRVEDKPVYGQANCSSSGVVTMGSTSAIGDFRHELGHAILFALGNSGLIDEIKSVHAESLERFAKAKKSGPLPQLSHEWFEVNAGVIGKRALDTWHEDGAEHYRGYHKAIYQDKHEGGNGVKLAQYRTRFPRWARIWDSWYSTAQATKTE